MRFYPTVSAGEALTTFTVSRLTVMTWPRRRMMDAEASGRFWTGLCVALSSSMATITLYQLALTLASKLGGFLTD